jgi:hypothetical protein
MKKEFIFPQPPQSDCFTLLVDDLNKTKTYGDTVDIDKIEYNREILDLIGLDIHLNIQIKTALSDTGITAVLPVGRYILIYKCSRDETNQYMSFVDHLSKANFRELNEKLLANHYSENIVCAFEKIHRLLKSSFTDKDNIVELLMV